MGAELKGVGPGMVSVSERGGGEGHGQLPRPRAFSQSAMHNLERSERGNPQALAELAQVLNKHSHKLHDYKKSYLTHCYCFFRCVVMEVRDLGGVLSLRRRGG